MVPRGVYRAGVMVRLSLGAFYARIVPEVCVCALAVRHTGQLLVCVNTPDDGEQIENEMHFFLTHSVCVNVCVCV